MSTERRDKENMVKIEHMHPAGKLVSAHHAQRPTLRGGWVLPTWWVAAAQGGGGLPPPRRGGGGPPHLAGESPPPP